MNENTKKQILYVLMILSVLPYIFFINQPKWSELGSAFLYLSSILGYIGISLMVWQLVIGTRSIAGLYFKDLPGLLKTHSLLGKYGVLLIFMHPVFYILSRDESLSYIFTLNFSSTFDTGVSYGRLALYGLIIIWITSAIARGMIKYRPWKYIHYLTYPILGLSLLHVPNTGNSIGESGVWFMWVLSVAISIICVILRLRHIFGYGKLSFKIVDKKSISLGVWQLQLKPNFKGFNIKKGQYVYLQRKLIGEEHPFSVLDFNPKNGQIIITFKVFGRFTKKLSNVAIGQNLYVDGPYGIFTSETYELDNQPRVFIAGGIGITPFVRHILDPNRPQTHLFYANKSYSSASYRQTLKQSLGDKYIDILSEQQVKNQLGSNIESGHIDSNVFAKYLDQPSNHKYYICGPVGMIDSARNALISLGVSEHQIHSEKFEF